MNSLVAIALNGFREARRNRVTVVVSIFAAGLILSSTLLMDATVATLERSLVDFGLGSMGVLLVVLTIFLSSGVLSREIERKTLFLVVSKPITRRTFLLGRMAGNMVTLATVLAAMGCLLLLELLVLRVPIGAVHLIALAMLWFELLVVASIGTLMSSFTGQVVSIFVTSSLYFAGHLGPDIYKLAAKAKVPALQALGKAVYYLLPNLDRLNFRPYAALGKAAESSTVFSAAAYGLSYAAILLGLAVLIFDRRDFK
jgi:ABC-type transport system involved in multi-copper enzyme maturation permease subunit